MPTSAAHLVSVYIYIYIYCLSLARRAFLHMRACKFVHHALLRMCAR